MADTPATPLDALVADVEYQAVAELQPVIDLTEHARSLELRVAELTALLRDGVELCRHAKFDNGVHDQSGRSEADYWAGEWLARIDSALEGK